ncbi:MULTISPECIES: SOS response-associated peptidase [Cupriavidus]
MCNNYVPVQPQLLRDVYGVEPPTAAYPPETWPDYMAPIIRLGPDGVPCATLANFGLVPKARIPQGVKPFDTTNARSETLGERRTFSGPWNAAQLAIMPATSIFEPNYEPTNGEGGKRSVRYRIWLQDQPEFGIAGLWREWPDGFTSMTMITVNADTHPLMRRMHAPGKEKRSVVMLAADQWDDWLRCRDPEQARSFFRLYPAEQMATAPAPRAPRTRASSPG